jgi:hypothetical protein
MKKLNNCVVENCIPTPSSCVEWNGGDIEFLGICNGDSLNTLLWEVINKLEEIAGEDLSSFDIDALLEICNQKAPQEITILNILNVLKANQICLKDFIDGLSEQLAELLNIQNVNVNLKCYATFDNLGNSLSITRDSLDQLVIDNLCNHKLRIETLEGKVTDLQSQINNLDLTPEPSEMNVATCLDGVAKPTSTQLVTTTQELCDLQDATGDPADIASAMAQTPGTDNARYGLIAGWILAPANQAETINNLILKIASMETDLINIKENCCALTCEDLKLGFSAVFNEDGDGIIIRFTFGAGTVIPAGFEDEGSTGIITDVDGNTIGFNLEIANNSETEVLVSGLNLTQPLTVDITAVMGTGSLTCQKCLSRSVASSACSFCTITATGEPGSSVVIVYETSGPVGVIVGNTTTTTTSTTTTTTAP